MLAAARMRLAVNQKPPLSTFCQTTCERYISQLAPPSSSSNLKKLIPHHRAVLSRPLLSIFGPLSDFHLDDGRYDDANPFRCLIDAANLLACTCRPRLDLSASQMKKHAHLSVSGRLLVVLIKRRTIWQQMASTNFPASIVRLSGYVMDVSARLQQTPVE